MVTARCGAERGCWHFRFSDGLQNLSPTSIGLFGGSFDPPHNGHVALVQAALEFLPEVWVVPAGNPVHRKLSERADAYVRLEWMQRIFASDARVQVLDWETDSEKPTPTIETLHRQRRLHPDLSSVLLMGEDAFAGIATWVDYPEHLGLCDVAVFSRCAQPRSEPGDWRPAQIDQWQEQAEGSGRMIRVEAQLPDVSATKLRLMAQQGESLRGLVPEIIRKEIEGAYGKHGAGAGVEI